MPLLISTGMTFQAQNRETENSTWNAAVSSKIIMTTSVTRLCFTTQQKNLQDQDQDHSVQDQDHSVQDQDKDQDRFL